MEEKDLTAVSRIQKEIAKIDRRANTIYFFVIDTKGYPSGSLEYIYKLAAILEDAEYNVTMLYQTEKDEEFVGVGEWLGDRYANIPHEDVTDENVTVSPSDILFIPEIFSNVMIQTKKMPCKRIAILQNYNFILEQMPMASQWGDLGIMDAIVNTDVNVNLLKEIFPYVKTTVIPPYIDNMYGETKEPKDLIINIISKNQSDINKIIKPFYWKYPMYKWVSFRDLRGFPKEIYSKYLRESAITIWADDDSSFGYGALEAMKSGSLVIAKTTDLTQDWMYDNNHLRDCCVWFDSFHDVHKILASVVRAWITDGVPQEVNSCVKEVLPMYTYENTKDTFLSYIDSVMAKRKEEMENLIKHIENKED